MIDVAADRDRNQPIHPEIPALRPYLEQNLGVRMESLDLGRVVSPGCHLSPDAQFRCLAAIAEFLEAL